MMDNKVEEKYLIFDVDQGEIKYLTDYYNPESDALANVHFPKHLEDELKQRLQMLLSLKDELISQVSNANKSPQPRQGGQTPENMQTLTTEKRKEKEYTYE